jgi:hypothetical protein
MSPSKAPYASTLGRDMALCSCCASTLGRPYEYGREGVYVSSARWGAGEASYLSANTSSSPTEAYGRPRPDSIPPGDEGGMNDGSLWLRRSSRNARPDKTRRPIQAPSASQSMIAEAFLVRHQPPRPFL